MFAPPIRLTVPNSALLVIDAQEKLLARIRTREDTQQSLLTCKDPETAKRRRQALDRIATCMKEGADLLQSQFFLESGHAFQTSLFADARALVRFADDCAKPEEERSVGDWKSYRQDLERCFAEPRPIVVEMEIAKLDEFVRRFMNSQRTAQARGRQKIMNRLIASKTNAIRRFVHQGVNRTLDIEVTSQKYSNQSNTLYNSKRYFGEQQPARVTASRCA